MVNNTVIWDIGAGVEDFRWSTYITSTGLSGYSSSSILFLERFLHGILFILAYMHDEKTGILHFSSLLGSISCSAIIYSLRNDQCPNIWWDFNFSAGRLGSPLYFSYTTILACLLGVISLMPFSLNWVVDQDFLKAPSWLACLSTSLSTSLNPAAAC